MRKKNNFSSKFLLATQHVHQPTRALIVNRYSVFVLEVRDLLGSKTPRRDRLTSPLTMLGICISSSNLFPPPSGRSISRCCSPALQLLQA